MVSNRYYLVRKPQKRNYEQLVERFSRADSIRGLMLCNVPHKLDRYPPDTTGYRYHKLWTIPINCCRYSKKIGY